MTRVEEQVFTDKLKALRYSREHSGEFFAAYIPFIEPETRYVVAISEHRARLALVDYLMGVKKWTKRQQDAEYIAALEDEAAKAEEKAEAVMAAEEL